MKKIMNADGLKGIIIIIVSAFLMGYAIYLGHYEIIILFPIFYIIAYFLSKFKGKGNQ